ncbi:MAG: phosphoglycerate kinase [Phycisphaerales bacterium]|nr:phosphoglycerate kinase [Phycisphaerales bacterium]
MSVHTIDHLDVQGKRVLIRVDFNVPLRDDGTVLDDRRVRMALPTIKRVLDGGGIAICMSHLGRPGGTGYEAQFTLAPVAVCLQTLLGEDHRVHFVSEQCRGEAVVNVVAAAQPGDVVLLDNLRFDAGEKSGCDVLAGDLAALADAYVNDAFGTAHREHASMVAVPRAMGDRPCVAGDLLQQELRFLDHAIAEPRHPFVAVLGGAKVSDKLGAIEHLLPRVDAIFVGGGMAYTFLAAQGMPIGDSLLEDNMVDTAAGLLAVAATAGKVIHLPVDHVCAQSIGPDVDTRTADTVPEGWMGLDIGPATRTAWSNALHAAGTVVWNGPMGVFEVPPFDAGTMAVGAALAKASAENDAVTIVGGGETAAAVEAAGVAGALSHVSTGGGASLRMLEGAPFQSVICLDRS